MTTMTTLTDIATAITLNVGKAALAVAVWASDQLEQLQLGIIDVCMLCGREIDGDHPELCDRCLVLLRDVVGAYDAAKAKEARTVHPAAGVWTAGNGTYLSGSHIADAVVDATEDEQVNYGPMCENCGSAATYTLELGANAGKLSCWCGALVRDKTEEEAAGVEPIAGSVCVMHGQRECTNCVRHQREFTAPGVTEDDPRATGIAWASVDQATDDDRARWAEHDKDKAGAPDRSGSGSRAHVIPESRNGVMLDSLGRPLNESLLPIDTANYGPYSGAEPGTPGPDEAECVNCGQLAVDHLPGRHSIYGSCRPEYAMAPRPDDSDVTDPVELEELQQLEERIGIRKLRELRHRFAKSAERYPTDQGTGHRYLAMLRRHVLSEEVARLEDALPLEVRRRQAERSNGDTARYLGLLQDAERRLRHWRPAEVDHAAEFDAAADPDDDAPFF
jgi:hypothetical protein